MAKDTSPLKKQENALDVIEAAKHVSVSMPMSASPVHLAQYFTIRRVLTTALHGISQTLRLPFATDAQRTVYLAAVSICP